MSFIRSSKFRHVYAQERKKEDCFEVPVTGNAFESDFSAVNPKFLALVARSNGAFIILKHEEAGKVDLKNLNLVHGHQGPVIDLKWNPYNDNILASAGDDGHIRIWFISDEVDTSDLQPIRILKHHIKRVCMLQWHPSAQNILAACSFDGKVSFWNVDKGELIHDIDSHEAEVFGISWNYNGSQIATVCKDNKLRIFDAHTGEKLQESTKTAHESKKILKVVWLGRKNLIATTGLNKMMERELKIWRATDLGKFIAVHRLEPSSGCLLPYYDPDNNVLFTAIKGDGLIQYFEVDDKASPLHFLTEFRAPSKPQKALCAMPKRGLDVTTNEIMRLYKIHNLQAMVEPLSMIVPRKAETFQQDIYPDCIGYEPALTAEEWIAGENKSPILISMENMSEPSEAKNDMTDYVNQASTEDNGAEVDEMKEKITALEQELATLREQLTEKDATIEELKSKLAPAPDEE